MKFYTLLLLQFVVTSIFCQNDSCSVTIVEDTTDNGILLRAVVTGKPPFAYFWADNTFMETTIPMEQEIM